MSGEKGNILLICQYASPLKYGFGTRHYYFAKHWQDAGYDVTIVASDYHHFIHTPPPVNGNYTVEEVDGIRTVWIKGFRFRNPNGMGRVYGWLVFLFKLCRMPLNLFPKPDYILVSSLSLLPVVYASRLKRKVKAKRFILEIRDIWPQTFIDINKGSSFHPLVWFLGWFERFGYKKADTIVGTMPNLAEHIKTVIRTDFDCHCIPQGIDPEFMSNYETVDDEFIESYFPQGKFIVGYAGTLGISNALSTFIEAARILEKSKPEIVFMLIGDGHKKQELKELAADLTNVIFVPKVQKNKVQSLLKYCNLLYDSVMDVKIYQYGLSRNKWMDYMYSEKPLIISFSGYPSLVNEAECGFFVKSEDERELAEKIAELSEMSQDELTAIGKRGRDYLLKNRTFEKLAYEYSQLF